MGDGTNGWRKDPNKKGHHSRRHETDEAHTRARMRYLGGESRKAARQEGAVARKIAHDERSNEEQLALLRERGHGHCREAQVLAENVRAAFA